MTKADFTFKAEDLVSQLESLIEQMPSRGLKEADCQKMYLINTLSKFSYAINGTEDSDFENEVKGVYVSFWDNGTEIRTACMFNRETLICYDVEMDNDADIDEADQVEEYCIVDGEVYRESDGIEFDY